MISEHTTIRQAERTASRVIDGQAVVIVIDRQRLHTLNALGTRVWELADGRTLGEIADAIVQDYGIGRERALTDARVFLEELATAGAIDQVEKR